MIANLRDRIIVALLSQRCELEEPCEDCTILAAQDADAVISELRLREEQRDLMDGMCGQSINYMTGKVTNHYRAATRQHRYVTEWVKDE